MIAYIKGKVAAITEDNVILDVHDIGYNIKISSETATSLPRVGEEAKLYTYTYVREDAFLLYGFLSPKDLELFQKCIAVSGIGPKGALAILSVMDANTLCLAIIEGDAKAIAKAPGIGLRTAERLILELKGKIAIEDVLQQGILSEKKEGTNIDMPQKKEAIEALVSLGYGQMESIKAVNAIEGIETMDSGKILKAALKKMF